MLGPVITPINFAVQKYVHHNDPQVTAFHALIIDRKRTFLYNRVKKNGSKYVKNFLIATIDPDGGVNTKRDLPLLSNQIVVDDLSKYRSLLVVRDPIERTLSAFLDKFSNQKKKYSRYPPFELSPQGFEKFVSWLAEGGLGKDLHWDLQAHSIVFPIKFYTHVLRLEDVSEKLPQVLREAGYPAELLQEPSIRSNMQRNKTDAAQKTQDWVSTDLRRRLEKIYERDYNLIGR